MGTIYAIYYTRLPLKKSFRKGQVLALTSWVVLFVIWILAFRGSALFVSKDPSEFTFQILISAWSALLAGVVGGTMGEVWDLFARRKLKIVSTMEGKKDVGTLIWLLKNEETGVRREAAAALGRIGDLRVLEPLTQTLNDEDEAVRVAVRDALEKIRPPPPP